MRTGYYTKIAASNLKKNGKFFVPHILTGAGLQSCFYIILNLTMDKRLRSVRGGAYIPSIMMIGVVVMAILSTILILYTNSFLMKQRKREFGLYNILGLEKKHVGRILFMETLMSSVSALLLGTGLGIVFYKLCTLIICRLLQVKSVMGVYYINAKSLIPSILLFLGLDLLAFLINRIQIARLKPIELLQSSHTGEKEPKVKWLVFIPGVLSLGGGYYIALTVNNPLSAINLFFVAVFLVIIGTYLLFISGSIAVLKLLKANKKYYYSPKHMVPVSGLLYRMKQNAVGLASITILATGVLVMLSTTFSLYGGIEAELNQQYPQQYYVDYTYFPNNTGRVEVDFDILKDFVTTAATENGEEVVAFMEQKFLNVAFYNDNGNLRADRENLNAGLSQAAVLEHLQDFTIITEEEYTAQTGENLNLEPDEMGIFPISGKASDIQSKLKFGDLEFTSIVFNGEFPITTSMENIVKSYGVVVASETEREALIQFQKENYKEFSSDMDRRLAVEFSNPEISEEIGRAIIIRVDEQAVAYMKSQPDFTDSYFGQNSARWESAADVYGMNGTFLFLGLILGFVFLFSTALIIYYKQISEGYEDSCRFQIMEKIGMSSEEVKSTIRQQILLVFFLPLAVAAIHMMVAFPILHQLLQILLMTDAVFFLKCTALIFLVFVLVYIGIYSLTAKVYYKIVH